MRREDIAKEGTHPFILVYTLFWVIFCSYYISHGSNSNLQKQNQLKSFSVAKESIYINTRGSL